MRRGGGQSVQRSHRRWALEAPTNNKDVFAPSAGGVPALVVGRDRILSAMERRLGVVQRGGKGENLVLVGPRGNGKTVLCRELERAADHLGIRVVTLTGGEVESTDRLIDAMTQPGLLEKWGIAGIEGRLLGIGGGVKFAQRPDGALVDVLGGLAQGAGLVVTVDEAHELKPDAARALLNAAQIVSNAHPLLLTLAGTPALDRRLGAWSATFMERSAFERIGGIAHDDVERGLVEPLAQRRPPIRVSSKALAEIVDDCAGYPYFLQKWGFEIEGLGADVVGEAEMETAKRTLTASRNKCYGRRWQEMMRAGVVGAAEALAENGLAEAELSLLEVETVLEAHFAALGIGWDGVDCAKDILADMGFLWDEAGQGTAFRAGIPSLAKYLLTQRGAVSEEGIRNRLARTIAEWRQEQRILSSVH